MSKSKTMVETEFLDDNMKNGFYYLTVTDLCFSGGRKKAKEKSFEPKNEDLKGSKVTINFCIFPRMQSCAAALEFYEFPEAG
jgi:hypothetical protein